VLPRSPKHNLVFSSKSAYVYFQPARHFNHFKNFDHLRSQGNPTWYVSILYNTRVKSRDLTPKRSCVFVCLFFSSVPAWWWPHLIKTCSWLELHIWFIWITYISDVFEFLVYFWRYFSVLQGLRIDSLFHPTYLMCTWGSYACGKEAGALNWGPHLASNWRMSGAIPPLPDDFVAHKGTVLLYILRRVR